MHVGLIRFFYKTSELTIRSCVYGKRVYVYNPIIQNDNWTIEKELRTANGSSFTDKNSLSVSFHVFRHGSAFIGLFVTTIVSLQQR